RSRRGDLEDLFELLHELGQLNERELLERVEQLVSAELCHDVSPCWGFYSPRLGSGSGLLLLTQRVDRTGGGSGRCVEQICGSDRRGRHRARERRQQDLTALEVGELDDLFCGQGGAIEVAALDHQKRVCLGESTQALRHGDGVTVNESDGRRTLEVFVQRRDPRVVGGDLGQRVLHHGVFRVLTDAVAKLFELPHRQTAVLGQQNGGRVFELLRELGNRCVLLRHGHSLYMRDATRWWGIGLGPAV